MKRGNLVIFDLSGKIWFETGEAEGAVLPHVYPMGLPYMEIPFGTMAIKRLISIDVSGTNHVPVFEDIPIQPTKDEIILALQMEIATLQMENTTLTNAVSEVRVNLK